MLDEEMDYMIREAAENHSPSYNDTAWNKLEVLLDKHLPQKKDRRRYFYFLLLLLLLSTGAYFAGSYFFGKNNPAPKAIAENTANKKPNIELPAQQTSPQTNTINENTGTEKTQRLPAVNGQNTGSQNPSFANNLPLEGATDLPGNNMLRGKNKSRISSNAPNALENTADNKPLTSLINIPAQQNSTVRITREDIAETNASTPDQSKNNSPVTKTTIAEAQKKNEQQSTVKEVLKDKPVINNSVKPLFKNDKKKNRNGFGGNFGLTLSAGPDLSFVELKKPGKVTLAFGAGLQYTFAKRLTLRTGFYVSKKIYSTDSAGYNPPNSFWNYYPNMQNIDANCKVYEIPLSILYNFRKKNKHNWFAGAGISSYLMKKETYDYEYKSNGGQSYYRSYTFNNKNKHFLSTLTLSGGYQYNLNNNISFAAEPYVKIPLKGVGFGKVELKGGGVLFTATVKPFARKK